MFDESAYAWYLYLSGASLLSISDTDEAKFINSLLEMLRDTYEAVWLGLYKNHKGNYHLKFMDTVQHLIKGSLQKYYNIGHYTATW